MKSVLLYRRAVRILPVLAVALAIASCAQNKTSLQKEVTESLHAPQRYPAGSIRSVEDADGALAMVEQERAMVQDRHARDERNCYGRFFMTTCTDKAKERRRISLAELQSVEVQANAFKRRATADARDKALAAKRAEDEADARSRAQTSENERVRERKVAQPVAGDASRAETAGGISSREAQHRAKVEQDKAREAAEAKKREENIAAYERKVREAQARQREVAERKAKKERERAEKEAATPKP